MTPAQQLTLRHGGTWLGRYGVLPAPGHSKRDRGVTVHDRDDGRGVIVNAFNADWREVRDALGLESEAREATPEERRRFAEERRKRDAERSAAQLRAARATWASGSEPAELVRAYLGHRGFSTSLVDDVCRFGEVREHPNIYGKPAMLALARDPRGQPRAVQITRLRLDGRGKAAVPAPRISHGSVRGCAVRLLPAGGNTLAIAEGVETALAFTSLHGVPCWASLGTENLKAFAPPADVRILYVAADGDDAGAAAADALATRLRSSLRVVIAPAPRGKDWADVMTEASA